MKIINNFENLVENDLDYEEITLPCGRDCKVYTISNIHDFIRFMGIGKYQNGDDANIFFRGQTDLYSAQMKPSLFRSKECNVTKIYNSLRTRIKEMQQNDYFKDYDSDQLETVLQHYGLKTSFIDCVDNIWIALWFATHTAMTKAVNNNEFVYYYENDKEFSYIFQLATDAIALTDTKGKYNGNTTICYDLRKALPSFYLRPHVQHAYMIKKKPSKEKAVFDDHSDLIIGIAKIPTKTALQWLGNGEILSVRTLFPSPVFDSGHEFILKRIPQQSPEFIQSYGSIQIIDG